MSIAAVDTYLNEFVTINGGFLRFSSIAITGLTAASGNTFTYASQGGQALPAAPLATWSDQGSWTLTSSTATGITITVATAGATSGNLFVIY